MENIFDVCTCGGKRYRVAEKRPLISFASCRVFLFPAGPCSGSVLVARQRERGLGSSGIFRRDNFDERRRPVLGRNAFHTVPHVVGKRPSHVARGRRLHGAERQQHRLLHDRLRRYVVQFGRLDLASRESLLWYALNCKDVSGHSTNPGGVPLKMSDTNSK